MYGRFGYQELLVILGLALLIFGPSQLPKFGRSMGDMVRELRGVRKELDAGEED